MITDNYQFKEGAHVIYLNGLRREVKVSIVNIVMKMSVYKMMDGKHKTGVLVSVGMQVSVR